MSDLEHIQALPAGEDMPGEFVIKLDATQVEMLFEWGGLEIGVGDQIVRLVLPPLDICKESLSRVAGRRMARSSRGSGPML